MLGQYEQVREDHAQLGAFMPEVIAFFAEFAEKYDKQMERAPHVLSISPDPTQPVDPGVDELIITFDRPMRRGSYAITNVGQSPEFGKPAYDAGGKVLRVPMKLAPGTRYALALNSLRFKGFKSEQGIALDPYELRFRTEGR